MVLDILNTGDFCSLVAVILILMWLGRFLADERQKAWGGVIAILVFLVYGWYSFHTFSPKDAESLLALTARSLIASGVALGLSWMILPLVLGFSSHVSLKIRSVVRMSREWLQKRSHQRGVRRQRLEADTAWRQAAPAREWALQDAEAQAKIAAEARRRREDAVAAAEVKFALHQHDLGEKFTPQMFQEFLKKYMGDDRDPQYVEERSRQLQDIIAQLVARTSPPELPSTLPDLDQWFQGQKRTIEQSGLDDMEKKIKLLHLQKRYDDLFTRLIHGA